MDDAADDDAAEDDAAEDDAAEDDAAEDDAAEDDAAVGDAAVGDAAVGDAAVGDAAEDAPVDGGAGPASIAIEAMRASASVACSQSGAWRLRSVLRPSGSTSIRCPLAPGRLRATVARR